MTNPKWIKKVVSGEELYFPDYTPFDNAKTTVEVDPWEGMRDKPHRTVDPSEEIAELREAISSRRDDNEIARRAPTYGFEIGDTVELPWSDENEIKERATVVRRTWNMVFVMINGKEVGFEPRLLKVIKEE